MDYFERQWLESIEKETRKTNKLLEQILEQLKCQSNVSSVQQRALEPLDPDLVARALEILTSKNAPKVNRNHKGNK